MVTIKFTFSNNNVIPKGKAVIGLDVGIGANGIYAIIGSSVLKSFLEISN